MLAQYGEHYMAQKSVYKWVVRCKCGRTTPDDGERSGLPSTSQIDEHHANVDALIKDSRWITASKITLTVGISYGSAFATVNNDLSYH